MYALLRTDPRISLQEMQAEDACTADAIITLKYALFIEASRIALAHFADKTTFKAQSTQMLY